MKFKRELFNGFLIFIGIGIYFLILEWASLSDNVWLRIFNVFIVAWGTNRTLQENYEDGVRGYFTNFTSAFLTSMIGAILSISALLAYISINGGEAYLQQLPQNFIFGGGDPTINYYCLGLLFESSAASLAVSFVLMQYWKDKVEVINKVD